MLDQVDKICTEQSESDPHLQPEGLLKINSLSSFVTISDSTRKERTSNNELV